MFDEISRKKKLFIICNYGKHQLLAYANDVNTLNAELNPICHLVALLEAHHILHVSRIRVNILGGTSLVI